jgi:hypothetical protein
VIQRRCCSVTPTLLRRVEITAAIYLKLAVATLPGTPLGFSLVYWKEQSRAVTDLNMKRRQVLNTITLCSGNLFLT